MSNVLSPPRAGSDRNTLVIAIAFSPDGKFIAVGRSPHYGGQDNIVQIYEWSSKREVVRIMLPLLPQSPEAPTLRGIAFSPDGKYLATACDAAVYLWYWRLPDIQDQVHARVTRNLSQPEWDSYFSGDPKYQNQWADLPEPHAK